MFDYPSVEAMAGYLGTQVRSSADMEEASDPSVEYNDSHLTDGCIDSAATLFSMYIECSVGTVGVQLDNKSTVDGQGNIPHARWDVDHLFGMENGALPIRFGGFLQDIEHWDMGFFGVTRNEGMQTEPHQRFLLVGAFSAMQHGGEMMSVVRGCHRSVIVGISAAEY